MSHPTILKTGLLLFTVSVMGNSPATAQNNDPFAPDESSAGPALDTLLLSATLKPMWRGLLMGDVGGSLFSDFMLWGAPTSDSQGWGLAAHVYGTWIFDGVPGAPTTPLFNGDLVLQYFFGTPSSDGTHVELVAGGYSVPSDDDDTTGGQLGFRIRNVDLPWGLEEKNPKLSLGVYKDVGRLEGARVDLDAGVGLWIQNVAPSGYRDAGAYLEGGISWGEDLSGWDEAVLGELQAISWRLNLMIGLDKGAVAYMGRIGATDARNSDAQFFLEVTLRIWPDAAR